MNRSVINLKVMALVLCLLPFNSFGEGKTLDIELTKTVEAYFEAWLDGRIDEMAGYLTEDSQYHPMGAKTISGREVLKDYYQDFVDNYDIDLFWKFEEATSAGSWGNVMGVYTIKYAPKGDAETISRSGRFLMIMELDAKGYWLIEKEITQTTGDLVPVLNESVGL